jgi:hypothetical protein
MVQCDFLDHVLTVYSVDETVRGAVAMEQLLQKPLISKSCEIVSGANLVHDG